MEFDFSTIAEQSDADLTALQARVEERLRELFAITEGSDARPATQAEADEADELSEGLSQIEAQFTTRHEAAERFNSRRDAFASRSSQDANDAGGEDPEGQGTSVDHGESADGSPDDGANVGSGAGQGTTGSSGAVGSGQNDSGSTTASGAPDPSRAAGRRPAVAPAGDVQAEPSAAEVARTARQGALTLTAAADIPNVATGQAVEGLDGLTELTMKRLLSFPRPSSRGSGNASRRSDWRPFGLADIHKNIPEGLTIDPQREDPMETIRRATSLHALELISGRAGADALVAAGWCTPSQVTYDLIAPQETTDGIFSLPEVGLDRGGLKHTLGPDFSDIFLNNTFFDMTEAHAIAGDYTKPFVTVTCPTWVDDRLDAVGLAVTIPFLVEAAYPELVRRFLSGFQVAHKIKRAGFQLTGVLADVEAAEHTGVLDFGSVAENLFYLLDVLRRREISKRALAENTIFELLLPAWVLEMLRNDYAFRNGSPANAPGAIQDPQIMSEFTKRGYAPQFIRYWQALASTAVVYPTTLDIVFYPAGTFVSGTSNVVSLNAVYDAASLAQNTYTALFQEEGLNVMRMGYGGVRATIPLPVPMGKTAPLAGAPSPAA